MYVEASTEIRPEVRAIMERNPFTQKLTELTNQITEVTRRETRVKDDIENWKKDIITKQIELNVNRQRVKNMEREKKALEIAMSTQEGKEACSFLNTADIQAFFESIGLVFVALSIKQNGDAATLQFIRPSKMIAGMPVSPMVLEMRYLRDGGELSFRSARAKLLFTVERHNPHPHISDASICMGNYFDIMEEKKYSLCLDGYQEQVIMLDNLLSTYNDESPYERVDSILSGKIAGDESYNSDSTVEVDNYATYTFRNSKLSVSQGTYSMKGIIPKKMAQDYIDKLSKLSAVSTLEDYGASLLVRTWDDDYSCNYDDLTSMYSSLEKLLPEAWFKKLDSPEDKRYYDEDEGDVTDAVCIDDAEDCVRQWNRVIMEFIKTDEAREAVVSVNFPNLDELY